MKQDETTELYIGISARLEALTSWMREQQKGKLKAWEPADKKVREKIEEEAFLKQMAQRVVGGF